MDGLPAPLVIEPEIPAYSQNNVTHNPTHTQAHYGFNMPPFAPNRSNNNRGGTAYQPSGFSAPYPAYYNVDGRSVGGLTGNFNTVASQQGYQQYSAQGFMPFGYGVQSQRYPRPPLPSANTPSVPDSTTLNNQVQRLMTMTGGTTYFQQPGGSTGPIPKTVIQSIPTVNQSATSSNANANRVKMNFASTTCSRQLGAPAVLPATAAPPLVTQATETRHAFPIGLHVNSALNPPAAHPAATASQAAPSIVRHLTQAQGRGDKSSVTKTRRPPVPASREPWDAQLRAAASAKTSIEPTKSEVEDDVVCNEMIIDGKKIPFVMRQKEGYVRKQCMLPVVAIEQRLLCDFPHDPPDIIKNRGSLESCNATEAEQRQLATKVTLPEGRSWDLVDYFIFMQFYELLKKYCPKSQRKGVATLANRRPLNGFSPLLPSSTLSKSDAAKSSRTSSATIPTTGNGLGQKENIPVFKNLSDPSTKENMSPSVTQSASVSPSVTRLASVLPSVTQSTSVSPSVTRLASVSPSMTQSASIAPSVTQLASVAPSVTQSASVSPSVTRSASVSPSVTRSASVSPSVTRSASVSPSVTRSASVSPSATMEENISPSVNQLEASSSPVTPLDMPATRLVPKPNTVGSTDTGPSGQPPVSPVTQTKNAEPQSGWLQMNNAVVPFVSQDGVRFAPKCVVDYVCDTSFPDEQCRVCTPEETALLNHACLAANISIKFEALSTLLISLDIVTWTNPLLYIKVLPNENPMEHAEPVQLSHRGDPAASTPADGTSSSRGAQNNAATPIGADEAKKEGPKTAKRRMSAQAASGENSKNGEKKAKKYGEKLKVTIKKTTHTGQNWSVVNRQKTDEAARSQIPSETAANTASHSHTGNAVQPEVTEPVLYRTAMSNKSVVVLVRGSHKFVLLEAVVRLFFSFDSIDFIEKTLVSKIKKQLQICTPEEEQAYIKFFGLRVKNLQNTKLVKYHLFEKYLDYIRESLSGQQGDPERSEARKRPYEAAVNEPMTYTFKRKPEADADDVIVLD